MALMQHEALLLAQAFYKDGTASFDGVSKSMMGHPATAGRHGLFSPAACAQHHRNLFAAERVDSTQLPTEAKQPQSRTYLKLIRKYYYLREYEARERLCRQEEQMRVLSRELSELDQGLWDSRLTNSYVLIEPSPDPALAKYAHVNSAVAAAFRTQASLTTKSGQSSTDPTSGPPRKATDKHASVLSNGRPLPEDPSSKAGWNPSNSADGTQSGPMMDQLGHISESIEEEGPMGATLLEDNSQSRSGQEDMTSRLTSTETADRHRSTDKRVSSRPSRLTHAHAQASPQSDASLMIEQDMHDSAPNPSSNDLASLAPATMDTEEDDEPKRTGKGRRRSSAPRDTNKRRRTETPQARGHSPALSDASRNKRVKTEEMESSVSTPVADHERTPFSGSDAGSSRRFRNTAPHLISQLQGSVYSTYFKDPVKEGEAVNYFEIVKRPMDLKTLLQHIKAGRVASKLEFTRDIYLIFANAIMYNGADNYVGQDAMALFKEAQGLLQVLEQAESRLL